MVKFDYKYLPINDLRVNTVEDERTGKQRVSTVTVQDEPIRPTDRFWTSLFARYGFNKAFFRYFDHREVFDRISERQNQDRLRVCVERNDKGESQLLAVSNPTKPVIVYDELMGLLNRYDGENITYSNGVVESVHIPRVANNFDVGGDMFSHRFLMSSAIDGYGQPNIYLSLLRMICSNGMIGYSRDFRSTLSLGKGEDDVTHNITRALDGFNNDDGFAVMRQRLEAATTSWASVHESNTLYQMLTKLHNTGQIGLDDPTLASTPSIRSHLADDDPTRSPLIKAWYTMTGDTNHLYGIANLDALSVKRQRTLPVKCTVYDMINFATELATHHTKPEGSRQLNAWVGGLVSNEYDMEGTKDKFGDFADFHTSRKMTAPELTGSH